MKFDTDIHFHRSQRSGQPKRFSVSSCLVRGSPSGHRLHHHQQVPRKAVHLPTGDIFFLVTFQFVCQYTDMYTDTIRQEPTHMAYLPYYPI